MKRLLFISILYVVVTFIEVFHRIFLVLDHLFFPSFRKVNIREPVIITGMPRTGSSFFYESLAADSERFTAMKLWEILLAPSIIQKKILVFVRQMDRYLGNYLNRGMTKIEDLIFGGIETIHPMKFRDAEEDEFLFLHRWASAYLIFIFPRIKHVLKFARFDDLVSDRRKASLMRYYKKCVQRHLYTFGSGRQYLAKGSAHSPRLRSLMETFPGCRIICLYRSPLQVVPSALSLFRSNLMSFYSPFEIGDLRDLTLDIADHWYRYPLEVRKKTGSDAVHVIHFTEMTADIRETISSLYRAFKYEMGEEFSLHLDRTARKRHKSRHRYSPKEFTLTKAEIDARYKDVIASYESLQH